MKLIVGVGNPGKKYDLTRHNVGKVLIDKLQKEKFNTSEWFESKKLEAWVYKESASDIILAKTMCFMNHSGHAIRQVASYYKIDPGDIYVVHDDLDIKLGEYKIQKAKGPKVHNGLNDIYQKLGTKDFWHVRIGIDNREPDSNVSGEEYVLGKMPPAEIQIAENVFGKIVVDLHERICKKL